MGIFDVFGTGDQQAAAAAQTAGINSGIGTANNYFGQGQNALQTNYAAGLQPFQQNYNQSQQGTTALGNALGLNGQSGSAAALQAFQGANPGYQFQLQQGQNAVLANQAATGQLASGATNLDLTNYSQGLANQTYNQYVQNLMPYLGASQSAASGIGTLDSGLGNQMNAALTNQGQANYGAATSIGNANANADLAGLGASANILGAGAGLLGLGTGGGSTIGGSLFNTFSDARVKDDIEHVGELYDGQPIYKYRYKGDPRPQIGLIAQNVAQTNPDAVSDMGGGIMGVDYGKATSRAAELARFMQSGIDASGAGAAPAAHEPLRLTVGGRLPEGNASYDQRFIPPPRNPENAESDAADDAARIAADRTRESVRPVFGRSKGNLTKIPEAVAGNMYARAANGAAGVPRFINDFMERAPGSDFTADEVRGGANAAMWPFASGSARGAASGDEDRGSPGYAAPLSRFVEAGDRAEADRPDDAGSRAAVLARFAHPAGEAYPLGASDFGFRPPPLSGMSPNNTEAGYAQEARDAAAARITRPHGTRVPGDYDPEDVAQARSDTDEMLMDMVPGVGTARKVYQGDIPGALGDAAMFAVPGMRAAMKAAPIATKVAGGIAGAALGLTPGSAESGRLSKRDQHDLELRRANLAADNAARTQQLKDEADIGRRRGESEAQIALQRQESEARLRAESAQREHDEQLRLDQANAKRLRDRSYAERNPDIANALGPVATVIAGALPGVRNAVAARRFNKAAEGMRGTIDTVRGAVTAGNKPAAMFGAEQLEGMAANWPKVQAGAKSGYGPGSWLAAGALPAEASLFPSEMDYVQRDHDSHAWQNAHDLLTNPRELGLRAGVAGLGGIASGAFGSKVPMALAVDPIGEAQGTIKALSGKATGMFPRAAATRAPKAAAASKAPAPSPANDLPAVRPGFTRFYHGGAPNDGGPRWLSPQRNYAEGYAAKMPGGKVHYVDVKNTDPRLVKEFDDVGTSSSAPFANFEAPEDIARKLKPVGASPSPAPPRARSKAKAKQVEEPPTLLPRENAISRSRTKPRTGIPGSSFDPGTLNNPL